ncbi:hypothetical protein DI392_11310 [Vibrio albus]|uniref:Uncharacterized protein n=1 Tax=Vibrio albus TaxID=2200953 RepID=A0A2U3B9D9_9VIBR|nr:hypothetical protein DI392_11310 [Vibrio albus]
MLRNTDICHVLISHKKMKNIKRTNSDDLYQYHQLAVQKFVQKNHQEQGRICSDTFFGEGYSTNYKNSYAITGDFNQQT